MNKEVLINVGAGETRVAIVEDGRLEEILLERTIGLDDGHVRKRNGGRHGHSLIGNIVLGACLSGFGDMLQLPVSFSVPRIHIESLRTILGSLLVETGETQYAVIVATQFRLAALAVDGYLIIALGAKSLSRISDALRSRIP